MVYANQRWLIKNYLKINYLIVEISENKNIIWYLTIVTTYIDIRQIYTKNISSVTQMYTKSTSAIVIQSCNDDVNHVTFYWSCDC